MNDIETNLRSRVSALAETFPSLRGAPGVRPWNALTLDAWAADGVASHGELWAAQFLLAVWDADRRWDSGRFDLMPALAGWDEPHRQAFLARAVKPWWL